MTDRVYLKKMIAINHVLKELADAVPFDQQCFDHCLTEMHHINQDWYLSRRRRPWLMILILWISFGALVGLIIRILFLN